MIPISCINQDIELKNGPSSQHLAPEIVQEVMINRLQNIDLSNGWKRQWNLDLINNYFSSPIRNSINEYVKESQRFEFRYGSTVQSIPAASAYLELLRFDPVTSRHQTPKAIRSLASDDGSQLHVVIYTMDGLRGVYDDRIEISVVMEKGSFVIQDIFYPNNFFPQLGNNQTLSNLLNYQIKQMRLASRWAESHPDRLKTQNEILDNELHEARKKGIFQLAPGS
jgi:hypothetical protein